MATTQTFFDWHKPGLLPGNYTLKLEQTINVAENNVTKNQTFHAERHFSVLGPRFILDSQEIQEMFPPAGSLGEYDNALPHVILKRSTLPWERSVQANREPDAPWLVLLLFEENEIEARPKLAKPSPLTLRDLKSEKSFSALELGHAEHEDDLVSVIDVRKDMLERLIPTIQELPYLVHVRRNEERNEEVAVLMGNRLPTSGKTSIVHLVSLENRFINGAFDYHGDVIPLVSLKSWRFTCATARQTFKGLLTHLNHRLLFHLSLEKAKNSNDDYPLAVYLNSGKIPADLRSAFAMSANTLSDAAVVRERSEWRIADRGNHYYFVTNKHNVFNQAGKKVFVLDAAPEQQTFQKRFQEAQHPLDRLATLIKQVRADHWWIKDGNAQYFISQEKETLYVYRLDPDASSTLRLPPLDGADKAVDKIVETYFAKGCVPLAHAMRQGKQTVSWYHGPFTPGRNSKSVEGELPVRSAEALLRFHKNVGMIDVSYAAAWEMGRLLTLQNTRVAIDLFNWKRSYAHDEESQLDEDRGVDFLFEKARTDVSVPPQSVMQWFDDLAHVRGVPFSYLVPDERMLPLESIRFFQVDGLWIECLLDGAFSIGRVTAKDHWHDQNHSTSQAINLNSNRQRVRTGFLLRSDVVSGWPGLLVDCDNGDSSNQKKTSLIRMERLSKNVLLCLFNGELSEVTIHQKPETLHFGFSRPDSSVADSYFKEKDGKRVPIPWKERQRRVVDITNLATELGAGLKSSSAKFAVAMIEAVEGVRLLVRDRQGISR